ncbi:MAG: hypothetical protein MI865_01775 [Proteobacteria bacterium]|nr:hypothetical protein [Pseudomonadota bacterium]
MANGNNLHLNKVKGLLGKLKISLSRIYHPGMSIKGIVQNIVDYVGDKNIAIGAGVASLLVTIWSFSLFAWLFALFFSIIATVLIFVVIKLIFYKPKEYSIELDGENTILSFVKDVHVSGESEIVVHSQPGYGKEKNTFVSIQLFDSIAILDCRNITSITDKSYRNIAINFFHPVEGNYSIVATSNEGNVNFKIINQSADQCQVEFLNPIRKVVRLEFKPA